MPDAFSTFVRHRRQDLDKTQREVGVACGVTAVMITQIEAGRRRPNPEWVPCLADALETDRKELCHLAARTWHPNFYAVLTGEASSWEPFWRAAGRQPAYPSRRRLKKPPGDL